MASSNKTDKLQLPQWQLSDKPEMSDFNDAFNKVEDFKDEFDSHKADYASLLAGGEIYQATLENGWTGTLSYHKNALGQLHLYGEITAGTTASGTNITVLPVGYRPRVTTAPVSVHTSGGGMTGFALLSGGQFRIYNPASNEISGTVRVDALIQL